MNNKIFVTQPFLPELEEFLPYLQDIWESKQLTNGGSFLIKLEEELRSFLNVPHICIFTNGTIALITALQALELQGEVITTPYSFVATTNALWWNKLTPVFVDVDPLTGNLSPEAIAAAITPKTSAILPVHVYGQPCDNKKITAIAHEHGLKVIYDAAHAFNITLNNESILNWGDISVLSFHATKCFSTIEGGATVVNSTTLKNKVNRLKNFGFENEETITAPGQNGKMNELQAAFGILQLKYLQQNIQKRKLICDAYRAAFAIIPGILCLPQDENVQYNYTYMPILIKANEFGLSRNEICTELRKQNIYARKYFYPLISDLAMFRELPSANPVNLPNAKFFSENVLCLPCYPTLPFNDVESIIEMIVALHKHGRIEHD